MKRGNTVLWSTLVLAIGYVPFRGAAQVSTGSNGSDGAFNPIGSIVVDMHDHPNGIYQYTSVNIPNGATVNFVPNANNTPVTWLVQGDCLISGVVSVNGQNASYALGGAGGPGGWRGGNGLPVPTAGEGPGGGTVGPAQGGAQSGSASYLNQFLIPLLGGSGGGGYTNQGAGGGGGGGAILIAASGTITIQGRISADGGADGSGGTILAGGSGGSIRLVASRVAGAGYLSANGLQLGRVRLDFYESLFSGAIVGIPSQGFQPIIVPSVGQLPQLTVASVGGFPVSPSPTGALSTPDAVISAQQSNPIPIVVNCVNLPLGTPVTVTVKPMNGPVVSGVAPNSAGTLAASTATVSVSMPRGGGLIYATAGTGN